MNYYEWRRRLNSAHTKRGLLAKCEFVILECVCWHLSDTKSWKSQFFSIIGLLSSNMLAVQVRHFRHRCPSSYYKSMNHKSVAKKSSFKCRGKKTAWCRFNVDKLPKLARLQAALSNTEDMIMFSLRKSINFDWTRLRLVIFSPLLAVGSTISMRYENLCKVEN